MRLALFLSIAIAFSCCGCLDLRVQMNIGENRSGEFQFRMALLDQMYQLVRAQGQQAGLDLALLDRASLSSVVSDNEGKLVHFSNEVDSGVRVVEIHARFTDAKKLLDKLGGQLMTMESRENGTWSLQFGDTAYGASFEEMSQELLAQQLTAFLPLMTGLKMRLEITVPVLVETNLVRTNTGSIRYELDFDRDIAGKQGRVALDAFKALLEPKFIHFKGVK